MIIKRDKKVVVALSGGVDSSVSALLLKKKGFSVVGVFMRLWKDNKNLSSGEERAKKVCEILDIPFYVVNFEEEFKKRVVDYFLFSLKHGETPNPCVVCNREIKFGMLFEELGKHNADYLSTGHYVRVKRGRILKGKDKEKDQSYFLWGLKKELLPRLIFPLGDYKKEKVKRIAGKLNLPTAEAEESQEICFISETINSFLKEMIPDSPGKITDSKGTILGKHDGLFYHTIGQRKGLGFPGGPYYVLEKDIKNNALIVTKSEEELCRKELFYKKPNFFREISFPFRAKVKIRYRSNPINAIIEKERVVFYNKQRAVTPGQSVVFYKREELLGGGVIK
jgi:tRNA-uridine 2-sulfurtransferase